MQWNNRRIFSPNFKKLVRQKRLGELHNYKSFSKVLNNVMSNGFRAPSKFRKFETAPSFNDWI